MIDVIKNVFKLQIALNKYEYDCIVDNNNAVNNIMKNNILDDNENLNGMINELNDVDDVNDFDIDELDAIINNLNETVNDFNEFIDDLKNFYDYKNKK